jgi:hypothetical protein
MMPATKTIGDLPRFRVRVVRKIETHETGFELSGVFDEMAGVNEGYCSFLLAGRDVLTALSGDLKFQNPAVGPALFKTSDESMPDVAGQELVYVDGKWEPYHVWMVAEPRWKWNKTLFHARDAIARVVERADVSVVDGEEVRKWIEIKENGKRTGLSRFYPVFPSGKTTLPAIGTDGIIRGGWNHAHCELCDAHVEPENYGHVDASEHWVCEACYDKHVVNHDLSFIQP